MSSFKTRGKWMFYVINCKCHIQWKSKIWTLTYAYHWRALKNFSNSSQSTLRASGSFKYRIPVLKLNNENWSATVAHTQSALTAFFWSCNTLIIYEKMQLYWGTKSSSATSVLDACTCQPGTVWAKFSPIFLQEMVLNMAQRD